MKIQRFAASTGKVVKVNNAIKVIDTDMVAVDATDGIKFDFKGYSNDRIAIVFQNGGSAAKDAKVKAPTKGGYAADTADLTLSVAAGKTAVAFVETARYANTDGTIICAGGSADVKAVAVYLG